MCCCPVLPPADAATPHNCRAAAPALVPVHSALNATSTTSVSSNNPVREPLTRYSIPRTRHLRNKLHTPERLLCVVIFEPAPNFTATADSRHSGPVRLLPAGRHGRHTGAGSGCCQRVRRPGCRPPRRRAPDPRHSQRSTRWRRLVRRGQLPRRRSTHRRAPFFRQPRLGWSRSTRQRMGRPEYPSLKNHAGTARGRAGLGTAVCRAGRPLSQLPRHRRAAAHRDSPRQFPAP